MMDVLNEPADQSRNAQSPEGLLPTYRPDLVRASRRRDLAIGRDGRLARNPCSLPLPVPVAWSCRSQLEIEEGAIAQHAVHDHRQFAREGHLGLLHARPGSNLRCPAF